MHVYPLALLMGLFFTTTTIYSQEVVLFDEVFMGQPLEEVQAMATHKSDEIRLVTPEKPTFPLAGEREDHLVCLGYRAGGKRLGEVVFTFADNRLAFIQARGQVLAALALAGLDSLQAFMQYRVHWEKGVITRPSDDSAWFMREEGLHLNLFAWDHPLLPSNGGAFPGYDQTVALPAFLQMGEKLENLKPVMEASSAFTQEETLDGSDPNAQLQWNCFGVPFAGFPRKVEARFGDGQLKVAWILTGKGEEERLRRKLVEAYGPAVFVNDAWESYNDWHVLLRKDKPEILLLTQELGHFYKKDYFGQD